MEILFNKMMRINNEQENLNDNNIENIDTNNNNLDQLDNLNSIEEDFNKYLKNTEEKIDNNINLNERIRIDLKIFKRTGIRSDLLKSILNLVKNIPATSVEIERLFSMAVFICNKYRNRFDAETVNYILLVKTYFLQSNLKFHSTKQPY